MKDNCKKGKYRKCEALRDGWDIFKTVDFTVALLLVVASLISAEPPRFRNFARQTAATTTEPAPYEASGWRPTGAAFTLPQRSQPQQLYGPPSPSYGPPPEVEGTEEATEATTEQYKSQAENIQHIPNKKPAKLQAQQDPVFLVVPQRENLIYTVQQSSPLVAVPVTETKIVTPARLQALPFSRAVLAPYVQIYQ